MKITLTALALKAQKELQKEQTPRSFWLETLDIKEWFTQSKKPKMTLFTWKLFASMEFLTFHIYRSNYSAKFYAPSPAKRLVVEYKCQLATTFTDISKAQLQVVTCRRQIA